MRSVLALLLSGASPVAAQQVVDWTRIGQWQDSLDQVATAADLTGWQSLANEAPAAERPLRLTLYRLRRAVLRMDRSDLALAADNALVDMHDHPGAGRPHLAMARALIAFEMADAIPLGGSGMREGEAYVDAAWRYLREGFERDPALVPLRTMILDLLGTSGDRQLRAEPLAVLRALLAESFPAPGALIAWARYQRSLLHHDSTLQALGRAALAGGDPAVIGLERAWTLMALGDSAGAEQAYWHGVERMSPAGRSLLRYDLAWVLEEDSLASLDAVPDAGMTAWLRRFWAGRDADAGNSYGARLREHLRRRTYALTHFRLPTPWRRTQFERVELYDFDPLRLCVARPPANMYERLGTQPSLPGDPRRRELLLDHRGVMYLRHGEPLHRVHRVLVDGPPLLARNESWVYLMAGRRRLLHFHGSMALGGHAATTLRSSLVADEQLYASRGLYSETYARAADGFGDQYPECNPLVRQAVEEAREDATLAIGTDSDGIGLTRTWPAALTIYQVGDSRAGTSRVLVTYAAAARDMTTVPEPDGTVRIPIRLRLVGYDMAADHYLQMDTVQQVRARPPVRDHWVSGWVELPFPAGRWTVSVQATQDPERGEMGGAQARRTNLTIAAEGPLRVSDPVPGRAGGTPWTAPDGAPFPLNPTMVWGRQDPLALYVEVHGLAAGTPCQVSMQVLAGQDTVPRFEVRGGAEADGGRLVLRRAVDLSRLPSGSYHLRLLVEAAGNRVERRLSFLVGR